MRVLAGDIGGTKTVLALAEVDGIRVRLLARRRYDSRAAPGLGAILTDFLADAGARGERACFGIAGPIDGTRCRATNLPWVIEAAELESAHALGPTRLVNDFQAAAYGIECLGADDLVDLHPGVAQVGGPRAVLGAGTGLGEAVLYRAGDHYEVLASEGGHVDFAPRNALEAGLLQWLQARHGHVSYERVVSGPGLVALYAYLCESGPERESTAVRAECAREDPAAVIGRHGVAGDDALCRRALDLFCEIYGAEAGNLALKVLATGGVYLAGGIAAKVLPRMLAGPFVAGFTAKGRMSDRVRAMPVRVVVHPDVGLLGAAAAAARLDG